MPNRSAHETSPQPIRPRDLAERLRWLRKQAGLTQVEVSQALGCDQAMVSSWEVGRTRPSAVALGVLARLYRVSLMALDTGSGFMEEAEARAPMVTFTDQADGDNPLALPAVASGQVMLMDEVSGHQTATDAAEAMSALLRALKKGRKAWVILR